MHEPTFHGHQASPPDSRWWYPQAWHQQATHCQCSAGLHIRGEQCDSKQHLNTTTCIHIQQRLHTPKCRRQGTWEKQVPVTFHITFLATEDELASVDALGCDEQLGPFLEPVGVTKDHLSEWSSAARVMDDVLKEMEAFIESFTKAVNRISLNKSLTFTIPLM